MACLHTKWFVWQLDFLSGKKKKSLTVIPLTAFLSLLKFHNKSVHNHKSNQDRAVSIYYTYTVPKTKEAWIGTVSWWEQLKHAVTQRIKAVWGVSMEVRVCDSLNKSVKETSCYTGDVPDKHLFKYQSADLVHTQRTRDLSINHGPWTMTQSVSCIVTQSIII